MVVRQLAKLRIRVRSPLPAPESNSVSTEDDEGPVRRGLSRIFIYKNEVRLRTT